MLSQYLTDLPALIRFREHYALALVATAPDAASRLAYLASELRTEPAR